MFTNKRSLSKLTFLAFQASQVTKATAYNTYRSVMAQKRNSHIIWDACVYVYLVHVYCILPRGILMDSMKFISTYDGMYCSALCVYGVEEFM